MKKYKRILSLLLSSVILVCSLSIVFCAEAKTKKPAKVTGVKFVSSIEASQDPWLVYATLKWKRQKGVKGYQIYFSQSGGKVTKKGWKNNYHTFGFNPMGRNMGDAYVKVRAYKVKKGKRVYGPWSKKLYILS